MNEHILVLGDSGAKTAFFGFAPAKKIKKTSWERE